MFDQFAMDVAGFFGRQFGVQRGGGDAQLAHGGDLVVHQGNQRRDDDGGAGPTKSGNLITNAFAAAGRHQHQRVAAGDNVADDGFLGTAKAGEAEDAAEDGEGVVVHEHMVGRFRVVHRGRIVLDEGPQH